MYSKKLGNNMTYYLNSLTMDNVVPYIEWVKREQELGGIIFNMASSLMFPASMNLDKFADQLITTSKINLKDQEKEVAIQKVAEYFRNILNKHDNPINAYSHLFDIQEPQTHLLKFLNDKFLSQCPYYFYSMIKNQTDDIVMMMTVAINPEYTDSFHMYIFRPIITLIKSIIYDIPLPKRISVGLHSITADTLYSKYGGKLNYVWFNPLTKMKKILESKGIDMRKNMKGPPICGFSFNTRITVDFNFLNIWKDILL